MDRGPESTASDRALRGRRHSAAGIVFCLMTVLSGWAAVISGANLTYLVVGTMVGALIVSELFALWNLRGVHVRRELPRHLYAGKPFGVKLTVENRGLPLSGFSLKVHDGAPAGLELAECRRYVLRVEPGAREELGYRATFCTRGRHCFSALVLHSRFPFGLLGKRRTISQPHEVVVYPRLGILKSRLAHLGSGLVYTQGQQMSKREGREDFFGLRDYRPGDNPRRIHWKRSARLQKALVMQFVKTPEREVDIYVDDQAAAEHGEQLEVCLSLAATLAADLRGKGHPFTLKLPGLRRLECCGKRGEYLAIMRSLALLECSADGLQADDVQDGSNRLAILVFPEAARAGEHFASAVKARYPETLVPVPGAGQFDSFFSLDSQA